MDRLPALAADLVRRGVNVISVPGSVIAALAAKAATTTIPIVFEMGLDPVAVKLVTSLNRPEGNVTGITSLNVEVGPKRLELLHELLPSVKKIAVLVNPTNQLNTETTIKDLHDPARARGLELHLLNASTERDFETAFAGLAQLQAGALIVAGDIFFHSRPQQLAALSLKYARPSSHGRARIRHGRWIDKLWRRHPRELTPTSRCLHRSRPQGREAGGPPRSTSYEAPTGYQFKNREGARHHGIVSLSLAAPTR